jgi:glycosyltransferase involved in cell wall biosynthesis
MKKDTLPLVSVIVTTRNEEKNIATCLKSITAQTYKNIEIIVVDNNSTDGTKQISISFTKLVFDKGPERSAQRNFGASKSHGEYLLFLDADMKLSKNVIEDCVSKIKTSKVGGIIIPEESYGIGFWARCKALERSYYVGVNGIEAARFYSKLVFNKNNGFDRKMISGEDWDLSSRVQRDQKVDRVESFIYHNEGELSLISTIQKKYYYATKISVYLNKKRDTIESENPINIFIRYKLFFTDYKKIFRDPILFSGMIFMKTCEFIAGFFGFYLQIK